MHELDDVFNEELLKAAVAAVRLKKEAVIPGAGGGDPSMGGGAPPMDPSMLGGAPPTDPSMGGGAPMDPAMMGGAPPVDPALGGGADPAMQAMIQAEVQKALSSTGGSSSAGPAAGGKAGKPDVAVELQKLVDSVYKIGVGLTALYAHIGFDAPPALMFGQPPATVDPALAQIANTPGGGFGQGDPAMGGAAPPPGLGLGDGTPKQAEEAFDVSELLAEINDFQRKGANFALDRTAGGSFTDAVKAATYNAISPASVGSLVDTVPNHNVSPLSFASQLRRRARGG